MSIGRIMYSKMPTKPKLSHFFGFGLPSILKPTCLFFDFTQNTEESWFHSVTVQCVLPVTKKQVILEMSTNDDKHI